MPTDPGQADHLNLLDDLLARANRAGADAAERLEAIGYMQDDE